jgi:hypothetical protein
MSKHKDLEGFYVLCCLLLFQYGELTSIETVCPTRKTVVRIHTIHNGTTASLKFLFISMTCANDFESRRAAIPLHGKEFLL